MSTPNSNSGRETEAAGKAPAGARQKRTNRHKPAGAFLWPSRTGSSHGTISLTALCFVAVLGISLAGYISVCSRAMALSNRSFQANLSQQLAELGIEEALRAFNRNDWSDWSNGGVSVDWDTSTYSSSKRAVANLTFSGGKFGQGTTATVKVRVDNYDAANVGVTWSNSTTYQIGNLVGYNGTWYRSLQSDNAGHAPGSLIWWAETPVPWAWISSYNYSPYDLVNYQGAWYLCHTSHTSTASILPTSTTYWAPLAGVSLTWSAGTSYSQDTIMCYSGAWYYCIATHTGSASITPTNTTYWAPFLDATGLAASPGSTTYGIGSAYTKGEYVYRSNNDTWYRCVADQPYTYSGGDWSDTSKWVSSKPYVSWAYRSGKTYSFNDVVYYNGTWYRCRVASATSTPTTAADWENALSGSNSTSNPGAHGWSSSGINYNPGDVVYYGTNSQWYRCLKAHASSSSITPASATYWSNTPLYSTAWDSDHQYGQNDTVRYNGVWYLSLQNGNLTKNPATESSYWIGADTSNASYTWDTSSNYSAGTYRCYGGVWYKCLISHTNKSPNETTYWTAVWTNSWGVTTGAPVVYAEAAVSIANSPTLITQLRAPITPAPLFPNAAGAATDLTITTGTGTVDSYDSDVGAYGGSNIGYSAVLAAGSTLAINGTTAVKGYLAWPSPPSGVSTGTTVKGSTSPASPNLDKTRVSRSPYIPQFDTRPSGDLQSAWATVPIGSQLAASSTVNLGTPGAPAPARYYYSSTQLQTGATETIQTININGPVILHVYGSLRMRNGGTININSTGSAEIHVGKQLLFESGNNGVVNRSPSSTNPDPKKLSFIVHNTATDTEAYRYVSTLYGVIYMPYTTSSAGLDIRTGVDIYGALSAREITFTSEANLHYDTTLRHATVSGVDQPYAVTEWRELPGSEQATMP